MKKEILGGLIIGLIIVGGIIGIGYYRYSAEQKTINDYANMLNGMTDEQRQAWLNQQLESMDDYVASTCDAIISEKISEAECEQLNSEDRDICYYCFAIEKQSAKLCENINTNDLKASCKNNLVSSAEVNNSTNNIIDEAKETAKDINIKSNISSIRMYAETIYDSDGSYKAVNCNSDQLLFICNNVKKYAGVYPTFNSSQGSYCVYVKLLNGNYYCLNNKGDFSESAEFSGSKKYCLGQSYECPKQ